MKPPLATSAPHSASSRYREGKLQVVNQQYAIHRFITTPAAVLCSSKQVGFGQVDAFVPASIRCALAWSRGAGLAGPHDGRLTRVEYFTSSASCATVLPGPHQPRLVSLIH